ncbi:MAG: glycerol-3-phosphate acyltransferase [Clostridiales bacterium]|nr:glycerol-3-phosphate acyltransferase [Clostridiales bacterium]
MTARDLLYILFGYLSGSVLYALIFSSLLQRKDIISQSRDQNPGTANAFIYGGFWCGFLTLSGDVLKGFLPVYLFVQGMPLPTISKASAFVLAAPVIGHIFPIFHGFHGGKGIATSFGCLLGLLPMCHPVAILAFWFIFFSVIVHINPHYHRTILTYLSSMGMMAACIQNTNVLIGFGLITLTIVVRMLLSTEEKGKMKVTLL